MALDLSIIESLYGKKTEKYRNMKNPKFSVSGFLLTEP